MSEVDPKATSVDEVHRAICTVAADIANRDQRLQQLRGIVEGEPFRDASVKSDLGGLCIDYDLEDEQIPADKRQEVRTLMKQIGADAMHAALRQEHELLVGLVLNEARSGTNYFKRYETK